MIYTTRSGEPNYFKCSCQNCGKHIEFPSNGAGMTVPCPHCGKQTVLGGGSSTAPIVRKSKKILAVTLGLAVVIAGAVMALVWPQKQKVAAATPPPKTAPAPVVPIETTNKPVSQPMSQTAPVVSTVNDFDISKISLQKMPGSSLVYAVGTLNNNMDHQRFGVRIELNQIDDKGQNQGVVSDYVSTVDAHQTWQFKAILTSPHTVKVTVAGIREQH